MRRDKPDVPQSAPSTPATPDRLLEAGRALFVQRGFDGASVRAITEAAGANLGAVTYHFDSKREFYCEVAERVLSPLRQAVTEAVATAGAPIERIEAVVNAFFEVLEGSPDLPHFMLQEVAQGTEPARPVLLTMRHVLGSLVDVIRQGQEDGSMRDGDPALTAISIVAQPVHLTLVRRHLIMAAALDLDDASVRQSVRRHVLQFVRAALLDSR